MIRLLCFAENDCQTYPKLCMIWILFPLWAHLLLFFLSLSPLSLPPLTLPISLLYTQNTHTHAPPVVSEGWHIHGVMEYLNTLLQDSHLAYSLTTSEFVKIYLCSGDYLNHSTKHHGPLAHTTLSQSPLPCCIYFFMSCIMP